MDSKTKLYIVFEYIDDCEYIAGICATPEIADYLRNQLEEKSPSFGYDYYETRIQEVPLINDISDVERI